MLVRNINDFPYTFPRELCGGKTVVVPKKDNNVYEVPDSLFGQNFGGIIIVRPPMTNIAKPIIVEQVEPVKTANIIEIKIEEPKKEEIKIEDKPLKKIRINKEKRASLRKNNENKLQYGTKE